MGSVSGFCWASATLGPMALAQEDEGGWPREIEAGGHRVIIYQPQLESFTGDIVKARAAVSVTPAGKTEPVFGTVWFKGRTLTDRDERLVTLTSAEVPQVRFPDAEPEQEKRIAALLEREVPTWDLTLSLDRLLAALELADRERVASEGFNNDPPRIIVLDTPTVLVSIDGDPKLQKIENTAFENVVNTAFVIIHDPKSRAFYLSAGADTWYAAKAVEGPWAVAKSVPQEIAGLAKEEEPEERLQPEPGLAPLTRRDGMPTPVEAFARIAAEHGGVEASDAEAVQSWYVETVPTLSPERVEALLEDLVSREGDSTDRSLRPSYPRGAPLPGLDTSPPVRLPPLAAGWLALLRKLARAGSSSVAATGRPRRRPPH